ncbi:blastopia polyprotein [Lasius niger]|uniref:Blastopia polyprotein n=1 Tax=Lasius niger TaxID=67767 RepID=A0A0J7JZC3_LASNI|nr:blastopia polyprotein [Lasius niger]
MSLAKPEEWYKHVDIVQQYINSSYSRAIKTTPFELLIGKAVFKRRSAVSRKNRSGIDRAFKQERCELRDEAMKNIKQIQESNRKTYNRRHKAATKYKVGDLVAIQRTQTKPGQKFYPKFLGPYEVTALRNNRYLVQKSGEHEGPNRTSTSADYIKLWPDHQDLETDSDSDPEEDVAHESIEGDAPCRMAEYSVVEAE